MKKESLDKIRAIIIKDVMTSNINNVDKAELLINLFQFLDEKKYQENINILRTYSKKK